MDIVAKAGLPINALAQDSQAPERILAQVCQGKRARTIAQRCRSWAHASRFFETAYNKPWPPHVGAVLEYIGVLAEGKERPSRIEGFINALAFFEKGGALPDGQAFHKMAAVAACVAEAKLSVSNDTEEAHKAPQLPVSLVIALEEMVTDVSHPAYWRMLAWWRLLKVWGSFVLMTTGDWCPAECACPLPGWQRH